MTENKWSVVAMNATMHIEKKSKYLFF